MKFPRAFSFAFGAAALLVFIGGCGRSEFKTAIHFQTHETSQTNETRQTDTDPKTDLNTDTALFLINTQNIQDKIEVGAGGSSAEIQITPLQVTFVFTTTSGVQKSYAFILPKDSPFQSLFAKMGSGSLDLENVARLAPWIVQAGPRSEGKSGQPINLELSLDISPREIRTEDSQNACVAEIERSPSLDFAGANISAASSSQKIKVPGTQWVSRELTTYGVTVKGRFFSGEHGAGDLRRAAEFSVNFQAVTPVTIEAESTPRVITACTPTAY